MSEPEADPEPAPDAARVYDQLNFDRAPAPLAPAVAKSSVGRAVSLGSGAALLGALVYFGVRALTGYEFGLIAIGVGIAVGVAVRMGASGSSHRGYRFLALGLAYASIAATYVPSLIHASDAEHVSAGLLVSASFIAFAVPFLMLRQGEIMSVAILGIALWEAWKFSAPQAGLPKPAPRAP
jgi:hypothetical protein